MLTIDESLDTFLISLDGDSFDLVSTYILKLIKYIPAWKKVVSNVL